MQPHPAPPSVPSGLARAGGILVLIGGILQAVGALFMFGMAIFMGFVFAASAAADDATAEAMGPFLVGLYVILGLVMAAGAVVAFFGVSASRRGLYRKAGILGIVAGLLPPATVVTLVGGVLALVSPEGQAQK